MEAVFPGKIDAQESDVRTTGLERLAVVPIVNTTDVQQWDNLAVAMTDTIDLTVRLGNRYHVIAPDSRDMAAIDPYAPTGPVDLQALADQYRLDAAVIGRISSLDGGRFELETSVWSSRTGTIIGRERRETFGAFDMIEAADELVVVTTSALLGYRVDFGAVVFQPTRQDVDYYVSIDGIRVGDRISSLPQILVGKREIDILVTVGNSNVPVYSAERVIRPGEAIEVRFGLPQVTPREEQSVRARHELARNLLGQPDRYRFAFEVLSESRSLLADARDSGALETLREEQATLETVWRLDEEFARLNPLVFVASEADADDISNVLPETYRIAGETASQGEPAVRRRIERNGAAQFHLLRLAWLQALENGEWESADRLLSRMETAVDALSLNTLREALSADRRAFAQAQSEAQSIARRNRRPWPYMGLVAGLGGVGYGGYVLYEERGNLSIEDGIDARIWGSAAGGSILSLISGAILTRNQRADESFLRDWVQSEYGGDIGRALTAIEVLREAPPERGARIVVLGPRDVVGAVDGDPRALPVIVEQDEGLPVDVGRPTRVAADRTRLYRRGTWLTVVD